MPRAPGRGGWPRGAVQVQGAGAAPPLKPRPPLLRTPHTPMKPRPPPLRQNSPFQAQWNRHGRPRFHPPQQQPWHGWSRFHTPPQQPRQGRSGFHAPLVLFCSREAPAIRAQHKPPARNTTRPPGPIGVGRSVAVALGFEPRVAVTPHSISSAAPSAARTRYLTLPLYYSHPLGTQIGHARWEQSHIRAPLAATVKHPHSRPPATVGIPHVRRPHPDSRSTQVDVTRRRTADPASFARASTTRTSPRQGTGASRMTPIKPTKRRAPQDGGPGQLRESKHHENPAPT